MGLNRGFRRTSQAPRGYSQDVISGRVTLYNQTYVGFVMENKDALKMGRLKVWIPELSSNAGSKTEPTNWFTVNYCSPFAGATPPSKLEKGSEDYEKSQQSYGWWMVPPDLENEVVVMFINGDPNRGIYIGGLYQQFMNHMVPGVPHNKSFEEGAEGVDPPVSEYNKKAGNIGMNDNPVRPRYDPLHEGLLSQGLYTDPERGPSTAGARRDEPDGAPAKVYGLKTPQGHHFVIDESDGNEYIRLRTKSGAQIMINDSIGYIYMISRAGNSWFELSDDGVDIFTTKSFSVRAHEGINLQADSGISIHSMAAVDTYSGSGGSLQVGKDFDLLVPGAFRVATGKGVHFDSGADFNISAKGNSSIKAAGTVAIDADGNIGINSGGTLFETSGTTKINSGSGPKATAPEAANGPRPAGQSDRELNLPAQYPGLSTDTISNRMPTHEPWDGHPTTAADASEKPYDENVSTPVTADGEGEEFTDPAATTSPPAGSNGDLISPVRGRTGSGYGMRKHPITGKNKMHKGVDIAAPRGTPVVAAQSGVVVRSDARDARGYGNAIEIRHPDGTSTFYAHLNTRGVTVGTPVTQGQVIGTVGSTGASTGPHLHFEVRKGGTAVNPAPYLPGG